VVVAVEVLTLPEVPAVQVEAVQLGLLTLTAHLVIPLKVQVVAEETKQAQVAAICLPQAVLEVLV
jgi:hypothetical protein